MSTPLKVEKIGQNFSAGLRCTSLQSTPGRPGSGEMRLKLKTINQAQRLRGTATGWRRVEGGGQRRINERGGQREKKRRDAAVSARRE